MQTFAVIVLAMVFGARLGAVTVGLYLLEGALGLPVFAGTPAFGLYRLLTERAAAEEVLA